MFEAPHRIRSVLVTEVGVLEDYLLGNLVYRQVRIEDKGQFLQHLMSLGDFLEHRAVWEALISLKPSEFTSADFELAKAGEDLLRTFGARTMILAQREFKARLDSLRWNLESWSDEGNFSPTLYATEMAQRSRLQRLGEMYGWPSGDGDLQSADARIKAMTKEGDFIWNLEFASAFPPDSYWFLYRNAS